MSSISIKNEQGLALMGSLLLISMLAVMSTTFLLIMAADVRMAQSHLSSTQAYYMAESAAEIAALEISNNPSLVLNAVETDTIIQRSIGEGKFYVFSHPLNPAVDNKRELRIQAISGKAWHDLYIEVMVPSQDPRTSYPIVAWNRLLLDTNCQVIGGDGVWSIGNDPEVDQNFQFDSPSVGNGILYVSGSADWITGGVAPELTDVLDLYTNYPSLYDSQSPSVDDYFPQILDDETTGYPYYVTGDSKSHKAKVIGSRNVSGGLPGAGKNNPMKLYVWDYDGGEGLWTGNFNIDGTVVCPGTATIIFRDGDVTITPLLTGTIPDEYYPAIISKGEIEVRGSGTRVFNGLVYSEKGFYSDPIGGTLSIQGAVIARNIELIRNTTVQYDTLLQTKPAAAFTSNSYHTYPMLNLYRRRFIITPPLPP